MSENAGTGTTAAQDAVATVPTRSGRTPKDMALSLIVLLIPVLLMVGAYRYLYAGDTIVTVDAAPAIASAGRAGLAPLPPPSAPADWKTVAAQYDQGTLRLGYLDADGAGAQLVQSRTGLQTLVKAELTAEAVHRGETVVAGVTWQRWAGRPGETALVRSLGDTTQLLIGRGADLNALAQVIAG